MYACMHTCVRVCARAHVNVRVHPCAQVSASLAAGLRCAVEGAYMPTCLKSGSPIARKNLPLGEYPGVPVVVHVLYLCVACRAGSNLPIWKWHHARCHKRQASEGLVKGSPMWFRPCAGLQPKQLWRAGMLRGFDLTSCCQTGYAPFCDRWASIRRRMASIDRRPSYRPSMG